MLVALALDLLDAGFHCNMYPVDGDLLLDLLYEIVKKLPPSFFSWRTALPARVSLNPKP